jgi:predicted TIM-barrel fold metal-dependent hydrolase
MKIVLAVALVTLALGVTASAQDADPEIVRHLESVKAIDNHAHVMAPNRTSDKGYDQLRCDALPVTASGLPPYGLRFSPAQQAAVRTLYGFDMTDDLGPSIMKVQAAAASTRERNGEAHYTWLLEKAGIQTVLANRTDMPPELKAPQFLWVPYADALMFPLDNSALKNVNPDRKALFTMAEELERTYLRDSGMTRIPATLDEYVQKVVQATLRRQKNAGAVAVKFELAYLRSLAIGVAVKAVATQVYSRYASTGVPSASSYWTLQDYLFKQIALEAGRLGMAVHIHTGSGCGEFFDDSGAGAMLLSPMLNDPQLRDTRFVLLHGNRPRERDVAMLIFKPNVYADVSVLEYFLSPRELAQVLRPWLEAMPEHVMFGTDAGSFSPGMDWEETTVMGAQQFRKALALALTLMVNDGVVTKVKAMQLADGVLRGNAAALYGLK